jgi:RNA polymerase sigma-70 factor (ECF subfamily)
MATQSNILRSIFSTAQPIDWELVYKTQLPRVYNYFLYKTGDRQPAQDLTATTFERAWKNRSSYHPDQSQPSTWLFGIARFVLKEHLRNQINDQMRYVALSPYEQTAAEEDVENSVLQGQDKERLRMAILALPEREQDLIAMKYGADLTNREIAKITGLSETNVGSILHRTVNKLREKWDGTNE